MDHVAIAVLTAITIRLNLLKNFAKINAFFRYYSISFCNLHPISEWRPNSAPKKPVHNDAWKSDVVASVDTVFSARPWWMRRQHTGEIVTT